MIFIAFFIIREDNKSLDKTFVISYDIGGNILIKSCFKYSLKPVEFLEPIFENVYHYPVCGWKDQIARFNNESFVYDGLGNPTTYRNKKLKWGHLRNLEKYNIVNDIAQVEYSYNSSGIRTGKKTATSTTKFVLSGNKILSQNTNGTNIYFQYGVEGLIGFNYDNAKQYYYKKNAQGDIIGIYDENYTEIVQYVYDAWGNHECRILTSFGTFEQIDPTKEYTTTEQNYILIANTNPFRYRGYYYDVETGLYYLNSRYYDPELGRFINADDISILSESMNFINGLNLFSYCNNNPINLKDEHGYAWWHWLIGALIIIAAAVLTVVTAGGFAAAGAAFAGVLGIGGATAVGGAAGVFAGITIGATIAGGIGFFSGGISSLINGENFWDGASKGFMWGAIGGAISGGFGTITFNSGNLLNHYTGKEIGNIFQIIGQSTISLGTYLSRSAIENERITFIGALLALSGGFIGGLLSNTKYQTQLFVNLLVELSTLTLEAFKRVTNIPKNWFI